MLEIEALALTASREQCAKQQRVTDSQQIVGIVSEANVLETNGN